MSSRLFEIFEDGWTPPMDNLQHLSEEPVLSGEYVHDVPYESIEMKSEVVKKIMFLRKRLGDALSIDKDIAVWNDILRELSEIYSWINQKNWSLTQSGVVKLNEWHSIIVSSIKEIKKKKKDSDEDPSPSGNSWVTNRFKKKPVV